MHKLLFDKFSCTILLTPPPPPIAQTTLKQGFHKIYNSKIKQHREAFQILIIAYLNIIKGKIADIQKDCFYFIQKK